MKSLSTNVEDAYREYCNALEQWDGTAESAAELRRRLRELLELGRRGATPTEQLVLVVRGAYRKKAPERLLNAVTGTDSDRPLGVFIGDPEMGEWPFHTPLRIADDDAIRWLDLVGRCAVADDAVRRFIRIMFRTRRRTTWVPAARAFAALATRDGATLEELLKLWNLCFPKGLPEKKWTGALTRPDREAFGEDADDASHITRHVLVAVCAFAAQGGPIDRLHGFSPGRLVSLPLPGDTSDLSAVLVGLRELLRNPLLASEVMPHLTHRVRETGPELQAEETLREIADQIRQEYGRDSAAIEDLLRTPRWQQKSGAQRFDGLWSWLKTAEWFHGAGNEDSVHAMRDAAPEAAFAVDLCTILKAEPSLVNDPVAELLPRIRVLVDRDIYDTTPEATRLVTLAETLYLLEHPEVKPLPWKRLVGRALGRSIEHAPEGTVESVARTWLTVRLVTNEFAPAALLRDMLFDRDAVRLLAASDNHAVGIQVAVQTERLLREADSTEGQIRLLWALLGSRPRSATFDELATILRGKGTLMHDLVAAIGRLVQAGENREDLQRVRTLYSRVADSALAILGAGSVFPELPDQGGSQAGSPDLDAWRAGLVERARNSVPGKRLISVVHALNGIAGDRPAALADSDEWDAWLESAERLLLGKSCEDGMLCWLEWVGYELPGVRDLWSEFRASVLAALSERPAIPVARIEELRELHRRLARPSIPLHGPKSSSPRASLTSWAPPSPSGLIRLN